MTRAPCSASSARRVRAASEASPVLLTSNRLRTPCSAARCRATRPPSVPVPPVIRTVPSVSRVRPCSGAVAGSWARRGTSARPARIAICGSPEATAARAACREASCPSRSATAMRPGCSDCATRTRPHTAAIAGSGASPVPVPSGRQPPRVRIRRPGPSCLSSPSFRWFWTARRTRPHNSRVRSGPSAAVVSVRSTRSGPGDCGVRSGRGSGVQSRWWMRPCGVRWPRSWSAATGRNTSEASERTGAPAGSVASREKASGPAGASVTRSAVAPEACRVRPFQANGRSSRSLLMPDRAPKLAACRAASRSPGCRPNSPASASRSSGRATSA